MSNRSFRRRIAIASTVLALFIVSCNMFPYSSVRKDDNHLHINNSVSPDDKIVLGEKIYNPFSVSNMAARGVDIAETDANWLYFRVRSTAQSTADDNSIEWLKDKYGYLETVPLDREME